MKPVINLDELGYHEIGTLKQNAPKAYQGAKLAPIGALIGAQKLGYNLTVLPPGKAAFPAHNHYGNEEMFFIIEGEGELRIGEQRFPLRRGDVVACPPGGVETAHQIRNTASEGGGVPRFRQNRRLARAWTRRSRAAADGANHEPPNRQSRLLGRRVGPQ